MDVARPRVYQVQCQICPLRAAERSGQGSSGICGEQQGDAGQVYDWRREGTRSILSTLPLQVLVAHSLVQKHNVFMRPQVKISLLRQPKTHLRLRN